MVLLSIFEHYLIRKRKEGVMFEASLAPWSQGSCVTAARAAENYYELVISGFFLVDYRY